MFFIVFWKTKLKIDFLDIKYQMAKLFGDHLVAWTMFLQVWNYKFKVLGTMYGIQIVNIKFNIYFKIQNVLYSDKNPKHVPPPSLLLRRLDQHQNFQVRFGKSRSETNRCYIVVNNVFGDVLKTETTSVTQQEAPLTSFAVISNNKAFFSQSAAKWSKLQLCRENTALQGKQSIDCLNTMLGRRGANYGCKMEAS